MQKLSHLLWIDCEMTGLNPEYDVILEIASLVTTEQLQIVAEGPSFVINQPKELLEDMNAWCKEQHSKSGLIDAVKRSTVTTAEAQEGTLEFVRQYCVEKNTVLCGNTIWQDRLFLVRSMPQLVAWLHYRMIDVTSVKELVKRWYPESIHTQFVKKECHRALEDIKESIEELRHYKTYFFK